jgi:lantibiotic modifying enzyme
MGVMQTAHWMVAVVVALVQQVQMEVPPDCLKGVMGAFLLFLEHLQLMQVVEVVALVRAVQGVLVDQGVAQMEAITAQTVLAQLPTPEVVEGVVEVLLQIR